MSILTATDRDIGAMKREFGSVWGWFVALGVVLIVLGVLALYNLQVATTVTVYTVGIFMLVGAVTQFAASFLVHGWSRFGPLLLSALLYGAAGVLTIVNPKLAAQALTLLLAFSLIFSGVTRAWFSIVLRPLTGWGWLTASGIVSIIAGIVFVYGWPADAVWLLGMVLAVDLTFQGATAIGWGIAIKQITK